jgi:polysaccharide export outer membrane protein
MAADLGVQRVAEDGTIKVPVVGVVQVAGLGLNQVEDRIIQQLGNKVQEPEVIVDFDSPRTQTVMVSGDVKKPGRWSILDDIRTVVDAINAAGGPSGGGSQLAVPANQLEVVVRRDSQVILRAQLSDLLAGADIPVQKGDEIVVRSNPRVYTVLGAVMKSGNVEMTKANLSLLEALGNVGGLQDQRANKTGVYVFRMGDLLNNPTAKARVFRLDLYQPVSIFIAQQFGVQARDVVYVTNAPLYEYDKILSSIYRTFSIIGVARGNILTTSTF